MYFSCLSDFAKVGTNGSFLKWVGKQFYCQLKLILIIKVCHKSFFFLYLFESFLNDFLKSKPNQPNQRKW